MTLSPDPSLKELQIFWEKQFFYKSRATWILNAKFYEDLMFFFSPDRKPRDIFRADVAEWKAWLKKKGKSDNLICRIMERGAQLYRLLDQLEIVEKDFNPFLGMAPRRIRT